MTIESPSAEKAAVSIDTALLARLDLAVAALATTRADFVRWAVRKTEFFEEKALSSNSRREELLLDAAHRRGYARFPQTAEEIGDAQDLFPDDDWSEFADWGPDWEPELPPLIELPSPSARHFCQHSC